MTPDDARVTARIIQTDDGENYTEYRVGGVGYGSLEALEVDSQFADLYPSLVYEPVSRLVRRETTPTTGGGRGCPRSPAGRGAENAYVGIRLLGRALRVATDRHGIDRQPTNDTTKT